MPGRSAARTAGFTLIELLVVVAVLSAVAFAAFGLVSEDRAQARIDDTRNRLTILRRAILGLETPAYGGQMRLSGYVADNGRLPGSVQELLSPASGNDGSGARKPQLYASVGGDDCAQSGDLKKSFVDAPLVKGHRGNYLGNVAHDGKFRDGWGNIDPNGGEDALNFGWGWVAAASAADVTIKSWGADNVSGSSSGAGSVAGEAEKDLEMKIGEADWLVDLAALRIQIRAKAPVSGSTGASDFSNLRAALLVYENPATGGGRWRQFRNSGNDCSGTPEAESECTLTFAATKCPSSDVLAKVPLGRHLLVLLDKDYDSTPTGIDNPVMPVDFYPGVSPPEVVWNVRLPPPVSEDGEDGEGGAGGAGGDETPGGE